VSIFVLTIWFFVRTDKVFRVSGNMHTAYIPPDPRGAPSDPVGRLRSRREWWGWNWPRREVDFPAQAQVVAWARGEQCARAGPRLPFACWAEAESGAHVAATGRREREQLLGRARPWKWNGPRVSALLLQLGRGPNAQKRYEFKFYSFQKQISDEICLFSSLFN
jgi:hypothetical protein